MNVAGPFPYHPDVEEGGVGMERFGRVHHFIPEFHQFIVVEYGTRYEFVVAQKFTDPEVWSALSEGTFVKFRATKKPPRIVSVSIVP